MRTAQDLLAELNASDESPRIEAKRTREVGKSIMETVIAFANEPGLGGGYLLLGVESKVDSTSGPAAPGGARQAREDAAHSGATIKQRRMARPAGHSMPPE